MTTLIQKIDEVPKFSATKPPVDCPTAPPMAAMPPRKAIDRTARRDSNSSRMSEYASGNMPTPHPISTRPAIMTASDEASAQRTPPRLNESSVTTITLRLPYMSPSRPKRPAVTAPAIQNDVINALTPAGVVCSDSSRSGSDGISIVCETAYAAAAMPSAANVREGRRGLDMRLERA